MEHGAWHLAQRDELLVVTHPANAFEIQVLASSNGWLDVAGGGQSQTLWPTDAP